MGGFYSKCDNKEIYLNTILKDYVKSEFVRINNNITFKNDLDKPTTILLLEKIYENSQKTDNTQTIKLSEDVMKTNYYLNIYYTNVNNKEQQYLSTLQINPYIVNLALGNDIDKTINKILSLNPTTQPPLNPTTQPPVNPVINKVETFMNNNFITGYNKKLYFEL